MEIFHIARSAEWEAALADGAYRVSTLGRSLDEEGFVHCSFREQVAGVRGRFYGGIGDDDLVVLAVDVERLTSEVRLEDAGGELFPHVYGPIDIAAVVAVTPVGAFLSG
jgi:uncharacterized protein (DUF952 family)